MRPWKRLIADVLLDAAELAESAAKALREEPEPDDIRRRVAELERRQDRHQADLLKVGSALESVVRSLQEHAARISDDRHLIDLLREWARLEWASRAVDPATTATDGWTMATLAARKAGGAT